MSESKNNQDIQIVNPPCLANLLLLKEKFIEGLKAYNVTYEDILAGKWRYCGGDGDKNYIKLFFRNKTEPKIIRKSNCVCGHPIIRNYYISDGDDIIILGSTCIKRFLPESSRTCDDCKAPHKNRKVNRCKDCRLKKCDNCDRPYHYLLGSNGSPIKTCLYCKFGKCDICNNPYESSFDSRHKRCAFCRIGKCDKCKNPCNPKYNNCYKCAMADLHACKNCDRLCNKRFERCYTCAFL